MRLLLPFVLLLLIPSVLWAQPRASEIDRIINQGAAARAHWGVHAINLDTGQVVASVNSERMFIPASSRKLVPAAMVVRSMGASATLETVLHAASPPSGGTIAGDLVVRAVGDPSWTAEIGGGNGRSRFNRLARTMAESGITRIGGDLVIDASRFMDPAPMPPAWGWEDFQTSYGSIPSVFGIDRNLARVVVTPGGAGNPVQVQIGGDAAVFEIVNESRTARAGAPPTLQLFRGLDGHRLMLTGQMAADAASGARAIPMGDPVRIAGEELAAALRAAGISFNGRVRISTSSIPVGHVVGRIGSGPMPAMLARSGQDSDNFMAESLYLLAGAAVLGRGSYEASYQAEERMWRAIGVDPGLIVPADGSGLSRKNLVAPRAMAELLAAMAGDEAFAAHLAVSGRSGTLRYRLSQDGMAGRVQAKTGTLTGVSALAGYVTNNRGQRVAFAIFANNYTSSASPIRSRINDIVIELAR